MKRKREPQQLFGTKQVAELLKIPEWRVKNFSEGGAYGLPPSQTLGTGRGSRRLYAESDVCRIAIANELVNCGFGPEAVGKAVREIPESVLTEPLLSEDDPEPEESASILFCDGGKWRLFKADYAEQLLDAAFVAGGADRGIFFLNIFKVLEGLIEIMRGQLIIPKGGGKH